MLAHRKFCSSLRQSFIDPVMYVSEYVTNLVEKKLHSLDVGSFNGFVKRSPTGIVLNMGLDLSWVWVD